MIMLIMTQKGLDGVLHDNFKIGAQAGISVVTLGSGVEGAIGVPHHHHHYYYYRNHHRYYRD
jgi:hypothetical protein